jgi:hypothetical protein
VRLDALEWPVDSARHPRVVVVLPFVHRRETRHQPGQHVQASQQILAFESLVGLRTVGV